MALKSAYELAMERAGGKAAAPLSDEQKAVIAKVRAEFGARRKELLFMQQSEIAGDAARVDRMDDQETLKKMQADHAEKLAGLEAEEEVQVEKIKQS